jgi:hypothetical protein
MLFGMDFRHLAGAALCALLTTSCASSAWKKDANVTQGRWETSPQGPVAADMVAPRNDLSFSEEEGAAQPTTRPSISIRATTRPTTGPTTRSAATTRPGAATTRPARTARRRVRPELTGAVTVGSEASKSGAPDSRAHLDFRCGTGRGRCTVIVEVQTPVSLDNEHLELRLEQLGKSGNPLSKGAMTRQAGVLQGETVTYELSAPCGRMRISAIPREGTRGREGFQSRWTVRVLRFRCH